MTLSKEAQIKLLIQVLEEEHNIKFTQAEKNLTYEMMNVKRPR